MDDLVYSVFKGRFPECCCDVYSTLNIYERQLKIIYLSVKDLSWRREGKQLIEFVWVVFLNAVVENGDDDALAHAGEGQL